jgi:hypothetical protein
MTTTDDASLARTYINRVGAHDLEAVERILDDGLVARFAGTDLSKAEWVAALDRLLPALVRNDIRDVFVDRGRACVVYDFVTDTPAGTIRCVELLSLRDGRITEIELVLDRVAFAPVNTALQERAAVG